MKILCGFNTAVTRGWANAFHKRDDEFTFWNREEVPAYDAFDLYQPDIYVDRIEHVSRGNISSLKESGEIISIWNCPSWGVMTDQNKSDLEQMRSDLLSTSWVWLSDADDGHDWGWNSFVSGMAADINQKHEELADFAADISYVGPYREEVSPTLFEICAKHPVKVFGDIRWPIPNYLGRLRPETVWDVYKKSRINLYCDRVGQNPYEVVAAGGFILSTIETKLPIQRVLPQDDLHDLIHFYLTNPQQRQESIRLAHKEGLTFNTYDYRIQQVLKKIGWD